MKQSQVEAKTGILRFGGTQENSVIARDFLSLHVSYLNFSFVPAGGYLWFWGVSFHCLYAPYNATPPRAPAVDLPQMPLPTAVKSIRKRRVASSSSSRRLRSSR